MFGMLRALSRPLNILNGRDFACTLCGNCCRKNGYVYLTTAEIERMAAYLSMDVREFWLEFEVIRDPDADQPVIEAKNDEGCPLLDDEGRCTVHPVKPNQCGAWPFWPEMLDDETEWDLAKSFCPGLDAPGGRHYTREDILLIRDEQAATEESEHEALAEYRTDV